MNSYKKILMPVIVLLQVAVLVFMAAKQEYILAAGEKILLKCQPVDPRSLFSGDYVILNYEITRTDLETITVKDGEKRSFDINETIYIALDKSKMDKYWKAAAASRDIDWLRSRYKTVIQGRIDQYYNIKFGLEDYFVPQNEGRELERDLDNVHVEVSVMPDGSSAISRLFLNDREVRFY
ncbi:MAG TPA: GDYXXLXY domain-containing protein [Spirochaetota bacterium]|nr:GDYXXLXY domain-containing protein [Spirochaetota bacterium]